MKKNTRMPCKFVQPTVWKYPVQSSSCFAPNQRIRIGGGTAYENTTSSLMCIFLNRNSPPEGGNRCFPFLESGIHISVNAMQHFQCADFRFHDTSNVKRSDLSLFSQLFCCRHKLVHREILENLQTTTCGWRIAKKNLGGF